MERSDLENEVEAVEPSKQTTPKGKRKRKRDEPETAHVNAEAEGQSKADVAPPTDVTPESTKKRRRHGKKKKKKKKQKEPKPRKKKPSRHSILYAKPTAADDADPLADLLPSSERRPFLHGVTAVELPSTDAVRNMTDAHRHDYITSVTLQCQRVLQTLHDVLSAADMNPLGDALPSLDEQLVADMVRLKRLPLARRYVEMTLWQRVAQFNKDCLAKIEGVAFGAGLVHKPGEQQGIVRHHADSKDVRFNSFRDTYLKNLFASHEDDLEKIRLAEDLDVEHVSFLRSCLESAADLFANVETWDEERQRKQSSNNACK